MINSIQDLAFLAGIVIGTCLLIAVSWVWIRKQVLGMNGIALAVIGFALVGLTVWTGIRFEASSEGFVAEFEQRLNALDSMVQDIDKNVQQVATTSLDISKDVEGLQLDVAANGRQFQMLAAELQRTSTVSTPALNEIREGIVIPQPNPDAAELRNRNLEAIVGK